MFEGRGRFAFAGDPENDRPAYSYEGDYQRGKPNGYGVKYSVGVKLHPHVHGHATGGGDAHNVMYAGYFVDGRYETSNGQVGTLRHAPSDGSDGSLWYQGEFKGGKRHGFGTAHLHFNEFTTRQYVGNVVRDNPHQFGTFTFFEKDSQWSYRGDHDHGEWEGFGIRQNADGTEERGIFHKGEFVKKTDRHPNLADGIDRYYGDTRGGKKHGRGVLSFGNGEEYRGEFFHGMFQGQGEYYFVGRNLKWHKGEFKGGKPNGHGIREYHSGSRYEGNFVDGSLLLMHN